MAAPGQKVVLITGCSSGIGLCIATLLAKDEQQRYYVIATMRNLQKKQRLLEAVGEAYGKTLSLFTLDVCSDESVSECINSIKDRHIDILVNNAGVGLVSPVECVSMEEVRSVFETNVFGVIRMIKAVIPDMKKRRAGHIIVISSTMGLQGVVFNDVYAASKFAVEGFCESLAMQLLKFNINVSMIEPGPVHTEFELRMTEGIYQKDYPGCDAETLHYFKNVYLPASVDVFQALGQSPQQIAMSTKQVMETRHPRFRTLTNPLFTPLVALKMADESGDLSVRSLHHLLFNLGGVMKISMNTLKCLTCMCVRSRTVQPD
ncbi:retinol dehydrogenase 8b [Tachysurus fulvidraco]|uniref:retinol dehydrogenase 8b n=1 Tax=Tachysurus fulvidraco TaxID=1234273 RepID=UPI001FEFC7D9|nr:retinol dehydrogenase 8b [Tachysurus fulvidraco]